MSDHSTRGEAGPLLAEDLGEEEQAGADAGAGNAGAATLPLSPLVPDEMSPDDWGGTEIEPELVPLDTLALSDAANDNWDDDDDNPYPESDAALPDDSEEAAITQDLLKTTERGRFGDGDVGNQRTEDD